MVSSTLCPAVHILGSQNVYGRAEGIADHYWPWAVFSSSFSFLPLLAPPSSPILLHVYISKIHRIPSLSASSAVI